MRLQACWRRSWRRNLVFFDVEERLQRLSDIGDQLEAYAAAVDFEIFRADLEAALGYSDGAKGGRPPYDPVLMFKILVIQAQHGPSDDKAEFLINDQHPNARRSRDRASVEHAFAVQKQAMGLMIRTIGLAWARTKIGMANLAYNLRRLVQLRGRVTA